VVHSWNHSSCVLQFYQVKSLDRRRRYSVAMDKVVLDVVTGVAIPSAAILISTFVALRLAKTERLDAAAARVEEREQVKRDRLEGRTDDAFVRALTALATLNTINLRVESVGEPLRELRVGLTLLEAASLSRDDDLLAEWFEAERLAGLAQAGESMRRLGLTTSIPTNEAEVGAIVSAGEPLNVWARNFANNLRVWRRNGAAPAELVELIAKANTLH